MKKISISNIGTSDEDRLLIEKFMELPEKSLPVYITWGEVMAILTHIEKITVTHDEPYSAVTLRENMCRIKYGPLHESDSTLSAAFEAIVYFIKNFE